MRKIKESIRGLTEKLSCREEGFSLVELLITIPMEMCLTMVIMSFFTFTCHHYAELTGDWDLVQQVRVPVSIMYYDVRHCEKIVPKTDGVNLLSRNKNGEAVWLAYRVTRSNNGRYVLRKNSQPVTGGEQYFSWYNITQCVFRVEDDDKVYFLLTAKNRLTQREFTLAHTFYSYAIYNQKQEKRRADEMAKEFPEAPGEPEEPPETIYDPDTGEVIL